MSETAMPSGGRRSYLATLVRLNLRAAFARPLPAIASAGFMFGNNLIFFITWVIYFGNFSSLRGWRIEDMALLVGIVVWAFGVAVFFAGGLRTMAQVIVDGGLDVHLGRPRHPLPSLLMSRSLPSGLGDMASAIPLWLWLGGRSLGDLPLLLLVSTSAAVILGATIVISQCLVFWRPRAVRFCEQLYEMFLMVTYYPQHAYGLPARILLLTAFPAALVGFVPVEAVREQSPLLAAVVIGAAVLYGALALTIFNLGLRRYASGSGMAELR